MITLHLSSPWFRATQIKLAEQAAAALLPLLPDDDEPRAPAEPDPRSVLNDLRQRGVTTDYRFDVSASASSPPRFTAPYWHV